MIVVLLNVYLLILFLLAGGASAHRPGSRNATP